MINYMSNFINANGINLHYYRTGGNKPPLVLVHGLTDDGLCWTPIAERYAGDYDVIMVDMRGHGKSDAPVDGYNMTNLAEDLARFIQALGLSKPLVLGHSMGAITALTMAGLFPDLPRAILLEDPPAFWMVKTTDPNPFAGHNPMLEWLVSNKRKTHDDLLAEVRTNNPGWAEAELEPWINSKHRYSPNINAMTRLSDVISLDYSNLLKKVACPALLICADPERGAILTEKDVAALKVLIPQVKSVRITGAGHNIRRDQFKPYLSTVDQFIADL
jgi:N-formylmaleamate deformylase